MVEGNGEDKIKVQERQTEISINTKYMIVRVPTDIPNALLNVLGTLTLAQHHAVAFFRQQEMQKRAGAIIRPPDGIQKKVV